MLDRTQLAATEARVAARIREELCNLDRVVALVDEALASHPVKPPPSVVVTHGVGGLLHDFYTGVENVFGQVSPHLNGEMPAGETWHAELLHSMALDLAGVRPPVISGASERSLAEYLRFRHVYRHMYGFRLDWARVRQLAAGVRPLWGGVRAEIDGFVAFLDEVVRRAT